MNVIGKFSYDQLRAAHNKLEQDMNKSIETIMRLINKTYTKWIWWKFKYETRTVETLNDWRWMRYDHPEIEPKDNEEYLKASYFYDSRIYDLQDLKRILDMASKTIDNRVEIDYYKARRILDYIKETYYS